MFAASEPTNLIELYSTLDRSMIVSLSSHEPAGADGGADYSLPVVDLVTITTEFLTP